MRGNPVVAGERLEGIVAKSLQHNLKVGVSGHMCYDTQTQKVWQVLEGSPEEIMALWEKISKDKRHLIDEDTVEADTIAARTYPLGWGLRYSSFDESQGPAEGAAELSRCALIQLAYKSCLNEQDSASQEVMQVILPQAMVKNAKAGITGWLLFNDRTSTIYQVLEGPPEIVERLWRSISADPRHTIIASSISRKAVQGREFPNWSMAGSEVAQSQWASQNY